MGFANIIQNRQPKLIWTYWHQGFENAPFIVRQCIDRLQHSNANYKIFLLDEKNLPEYADPLPLPNEKKKRLSLQHKSDLIRTQLLIKYGGIWIDPTVFCVLPFDMWLSDCMNSGLFLYTRPGRDRIIANWFIASEKSNYLLEQLYELLINYWSINNFRNLGEPDHKLAKSMYRLLNGRSLELSQLYLTPLFTKLIRIYPYMIYHFMFYHLLKTDFKCQKIYNEMSKIKADGPHLLKREGLLQPISQNVKRAIDNKSTPLFKLNWKLSKDEIPLGSNLDYLLQQI